MTPSASSGPGSKTVLGAAADPVFTGADRTRPLVVDLDHARELDQADLGVPRCVGVVVTGNLARAGRGGIGGETISPEMSGK